MSADSSGLALPRRPVRRELREEQRLGRPDLGIGGHQLLLDATEIRAPLEKSGGQPGGNAGRHLLIEQRPAALDRPGIATEKGAELILLGRDLALDLRDRGGRLGEVALRSRRLQLRSDPELQPVLKELVGALVGHRRRARDGEPGVQLEQLEVRLRHIAHQAEEHGPVALHGGEELSIRGFARATDLPPEVDLPAHGHRAKVECRYADESVVEESPRIFASPFDCTAVAP